MLNDALKGKLRDYTWNPCRFAVEVLRAEPDKWQEQFLLDLPDFDRLAVRSCHGAGKTGGLSWAAIWWFVTRAYSKVAWTAPTFTRQVVNIGFAELTKWVQRIPDWQNQFNVLSSSIEMRGAEENWNIRGISAGKADNIEGIHGDYVMYIFDEAKGIKREIFDGAKGAMTKGDGTAKMLAGSVPGGETGYFYDIFNSLGHIWKGYHVNAFNSKLVSKSWVEECRQEWGETNPVYITKVLGDFVKIYENQLFPIHLVEAAFQRWAEEEEQGWYYDPATDGQVRVGADIAQFGGDEMVVDKIAGHRELSKDIKQSTDALQAEEMIENAVMSEPRATSVQIDATGIGGAITDHCIQKMPYTSVIPVLYGTNPITEKGKLHYQNRKAELYFELAEAFKKNEISLIEDRKALAQLTAIRYDYTGKSKFIILPYEQPSPDASKSPDRADAIALAWWRPNTEYVSAIKNAPTIREKYQRARRM